MGNGVRRNETETNHRGFGNASPLQASDGFEVRKPDAAKGAVEEVTVIEVQTKTRWTKADKEWLLSTVKYLKKDGYPKVAALLKKEVDKL